MPAQTKGWIKLSRGITSHWLWEEKPYSKAQAWVDILLHANHQPKKIMIKGRLVLVGRGEQARSEVTLADSWGWSRNKVRRFLVMLENDGMVKQQKNNLTSIISVCNYNDFQDPDTAGGTPNETAEGQQKDSRRNTVKNEKNEKKTNTPSEDGLSLPKPLTKELLIKISEHWNKYMANYSPTIDLTRKTKANQKRISSIKRVIKENPNYEDHEYWEGYISRLAILPNFQWQREKEQLSFDQSIHVDKFDRNVGLMRMAEK